MIEICVTQEELGSLPDGVFHLVGGKSPAVDVEMGPWAGIHNRRLWFLAVEMDPDVHLEEYEGWPELLRVSMGNVVIGHVEAGAPDGAVFFHPLPHIPVRDVMEGTMRLERMTPLLASGRRDGALKPLLNHKPTDLQSWARNLQ
jgi:hypothetical protein